MRRTHITTRRTLLAAGVAGAAVVAAPRLLANAATFLGPYGSGTLSDWTGKIRAISAASQIRAARDADGVFMFGDSIAVQDGHHLAQQLYELDGTLMAVHNWSGRPTAPAVDALAQWADAYGLPSRILMATGSNDIFDPPGFRAQVDRAMQIVGPWRAIVWVNVHVSRWNQVADVQVADQRNTGWINSQLAEAAAYWGDGLRVVRWAELLAGKPGYRIPAYLSDGVHTSVPLGQAARNAMIVEAVTAVTEWARIRPS
jgi:hypothetical protein